MSTELSSAKYFAAAYGEDAEAITNDVPVAAEAAPTWSPGNAYASPSHQEGGMATARKSTPAMVSVFACLLGLFGIVGVLGGTFGALGQAALTNSESVQSSVLKDRQGQEAHIYLRTIAKRQQFSTVIYLHNGICVLVGLGFIASCFVLMTGRPEANSFASTACMAAIFYNCLTFVVTWISLPSFEGLPDMPEEAASIALAVALGMAAFVGFIKIAFYILTIAYMSRSSVKAAFAPPQAASEAVVA